MKSNISLLRIDLNNSITEVNRLNENITANITLSGMRDK